MAPRVSPPATCSYVLVEAVEEGAEHEGNLIKPGVERAGSQGVHPGDHLTPDRARSSSVTVSKAT